MSIIGSLHQMPDASIGTRLAPVFGLALWTWLLWKIWKRPREWGLGVGIFLLLMIAFQTYAWCLALSGPRSELLGAARSPWVFALGYELPIAVAAICCISLRFGYPSIPTKRSG